MLTTAADLGRKRGRAFFSSNEFCWSALNLNKFLQLMIFQLCDKKLFEKRSDTCHLEDIWDLKGYLNARWHLTPQQLWWPKIGKILRQDQKCLKKSVTIAIGTSQHWHQATLPNSSGGQSLAKFCPPPPPPPPTKTTHFVAADTTSLLVLTPTVWGVETFNWIKTPKWFSEQEFAINHSCDQCYQFQGQNTTFRYMSLISREEC